MLKPTCYKARECPVDPSTNNNHRKDIGNVSLEHLGHGVRICHGIGSRGLLPVGLKVASLVVVEEVPPHQEGLLGNVFPILA